MPIFDKLQGTSSDSFSVGSKKPADPCAALQVNSTSRGVLPPRMTSAQRAAITAGNGLVVYDTTIQRLYCYEGGVWRALSLEPDGCIYQAVVSGLVSGQFGYVSANNTISPTDAAVLSQSYCAGAYYGDSNWIRHSGVLSAGLFSPASPMPLVGSPVWLARADDEPLLGAAGKLTATKPSSPSVAAEVGIVLSVNPTNFPFTHVAKILVQIKKILPVAREGVTPSGPIDGSNQVFTTPSIFDLATLKLYYNGSRMWEGVGNDFVVSESGGFGTGYDTVTMAFPPKGAPGNPDKILVDYTER